MGGQRRAPAHRPPATRGATRARHGRQAGCVPGTINARELLRAYHEDGDLLARQRLIEWHLPLVESLARRFVSPSERLEDLVQIGSIGLINAIDRFELERGSDLVPFAAPTIVGEIKRHLRDSGWPVRLPRRLQELALGLRTPVAELAARLDRMPTAIEVAMHAGVRAEEVEQALTAQASRVPLALSALEAGEAAAQSRDTADARDPAEDRVFLASLLAVLDERERLILHLRFFEGRSQLEIARAVGLSQIHVSRLLKSSLDKLREQLVDRE